MHTLQVRAGNLTPVTAMVQNLLMSALFQPFEALCSAANAETVKVGHLLTVQTLQDKAFIMESSKACMHCTQAALLLC